MEQWYTLSMLELLQQRLSEAGKIEVLVRARPHAVQSRIVGVLEDGSLKIDLAAPAEDGKGNRALQKLLAEAFGVSPVHVTVLSGKAARLKLVRITAPPRTHGGVPLS